MGKEKKLNRSTAGNIAIFILLAIVAVFMGLPLVYAILQAFKPLEEIFLFPPRFFVRRPTLENFVILFQLTQNLWVPFSRYVFNSLFISIVSTIGHVIIASMAAFPLAKQKFPGNKLIFNIIVMSLLFTSEVTQIPRYIVMAKTGLINTYWALLLPPLAMPLGLYLMRQFMLQIPDSILEAARIDGANIYQTLWKIVMPAVKPAWLTLVIFSFQSIWNRTGMAYIYSEQFKVLPTILRQITQGGNIARAGVAAASTVLLMIPPIVIFIITQSNVIETMSHSGMKG